MSIPSHPHAERRRRLAVLLGLLLASGAGAAQAQTTLDRYLPPAVPGYGTQQGVTVLSRQRPEYDSPGIRLGDFVIRPGLDEGVGYDTNPLAQASGRGSPVIRTSPYVSAFSDWDRDALGLSLGLSNYAYPDLPQENRTDVAVTLGGGYTIGRSNLDLGVSYQSSQETTNQSGSRTATVQIPYSSEDLRSDYPVDLGRFSFVPNIDVARYQFDRVVIGGVSTNEAGRNRVVASGGVTGRYELSDLHHLLLVLQGVDSHYTDPQPGQPSNSSTSALVLAGIDYQASGVWRYRLLAGIEHRDFAAAVYKSRTEPIAELAAIWTPTGLTTVTGTASRTIEEPNAEGTSGYIDNTLGLQVDHEYRRNLLLQGRLGAQAAQFLGGGSDTEYSAGAGITWLLNRRLRLSADYDYIRQHGSTSVQTQGILTPVTLGGTGTGSGTGTLLGGAPLSPNTITSGSYTDNVVMLTLHVGL